MVLKWFQKQKQIEKYQIYYWTNKGFFGLKRSILNYARKKKKDKVEEKRVRVLEKSIEERPKEIKRVDMK